MRDLRDNSNCKQLYQTLYLRAREEMFNTVISSILYLSAEKRRFLKGHSGICLVCFKGGSQEGYFHYYLLFFCLPLFLFLSELVLCAVPCCPILLYPSRMLTCV